MMKKITLLIGFLLLSSFSLASNQKEISKKQIFQMIKELESKGVLDKEGAAKAYRKLETLTDEELKDLNDKARKVLDQKRK